MKFYQACVNVAKSVGALMNEEQRRRFVETPVEGWQYVLGIWMRHHILPHNTYLREALTVLGYRSEEEMSRFLVEFTHAYWKLSKAEML